ncbi:hypothetical protein H8B13_19185 [Hymenobacter sp. BT188]|uniref:DUF6249 domain-containing protein n=1 Tax=Hymenobacter sp. BT188 TaxID=2763504 RepID=UPI0016519D8D|nr:DUF6249 domain-containing protein [Hymenobacter sp. BT188]MBC6608951.1 hypothetical protein [Hymenobacter sp. BT188]
MELFNSFTLLIVPVLFFGTIFGIAYLYFTARTRERLALIDKGLDPNTFHVRRRTLKIGMVVTAVVTGTLIGDWIGREPFGYPIGVPLGVLLGGLSLVVYYFVINRQIDKRETGE